MDGHFTILSIEMTSPYRGNLKDHHVAPLTHYLHLVPKTFMRREKIFMHRRNNASREDINASRKTFIHHGMIFMHRVKVMDREKIFMHCREEVMHWKSRYL